MGTDATVFLEFWDGPDDVPIWGPVEDFETVVWDIRGIESVVDGPVRVGRNAQLFGALSGIRSPLPSLVPPRGLPPTISRAVALRAFRHIRADDVPPEVRDPDDVGHSEAERRIANGLAKFGGRLRHGQYDYVTEEVYSASWLYLREVEASLIHHGMTVDEQNVLFASVMASMRLIESRLGSDRTRLVFWFDTL